MLSKENFQALVFTLGAIETSSTPDMWSEVNPLLGHCAVVALLAQDIFGGELLRASLIGTEFAYGGSHYWNRLPDGTQQDFTQSQFGARKPMLVGEERSREYVLSFEETRVRYEILKKRFEEVAR